MPGPKDYQIRITYWLDGAKFTEDFWTTWTIAEGLTMCPKDSVEFECSLRALNPQMRYRQNYEAKNWHYTIRAWDVVGQPKLAGKREALYPDQGRLFKGPIIEKKPTYFVPPNELEAKERKDDYQKKLFEDF